MQVALLGASGFVGGHIMTALLAAGHEVRAVPAPRLRLEDSAEPPHLLLRRPDVRKATRELIDALHGSEVVINSAGMAEPTSPGTPELFGANALLPLCLSSACATVGARLVHISSASVQGDLACLNESPTQRPFSPYSASKALGEVFVLSSECRHHVFRATSVHARSRSMTAALVRLAASPLSAVAGKGDRPTPQVLVGDLAKCVEHLVERPGAPAIVLQPGGGLSTGELLHLLGGRKPRHIPEVVASSLVRLLQAGERWAPAVGPHRRRLQMLWFGQSQVAGWLNGALGQVDHDAWRTLGDDLRRTRRDR